MTHRDSSVATVATVASVVSMAALALAATGAVTAAVLIARVRRAERTAAAPLPPRAGLEPRGLVILGAETLPSGPSDELRARLLHAAHLWRQGQADVVVASGGVVGELDEVAAMLAFLRDEGLPDAVLLEGRPGGSTRETIATTRRIADDLGIASWIAVSSLYHARRIRDEAQRAGLALVVSAPVGSAEIRDAAVHRSRVLSEAAATVFYALPPGVAARVPTGSGTWRHRLPQLLTELQRRRRRSG
jgi:uncharacterized SAM-binding protein YcdF (DUF218 family)